MILNVNDQGEGLKRHCGVFLGDDNNPLPLQILTRSAVLRLDDIRPKSSIETQLVRPPY